MNWWQLIGRALAPAKHAAFRGLALVHKTTRPRVALVCGDQILLVQNWGESKWSLPGGGAHHGEAPIQAAIREVHEELGVLLDPEQLVYVDTFELPTFYAPVFIARCDQKPAIRRQKIEIYDVQWFAKDALPRTGKLLQKLNF